tara:strand:+ start:4988 stop:5191 length:204 start_codon:yes stop_codon:yes gene_type:complete
MNINSLKQLEIKDQLYTLEEFGILVRNTFGGDNNISNIMLAEIFLSKYPQYLCSIKKTDSKKSCNCC